MAFFTCTLVLLCRGSKLVLVGENLDSAHKTVIQYISKIQNLLSLQQVR